MGRMTRREFVESAAVAAGVGLAGWRALAQDPAVNTPRAANHKGYEEVAWKARPFPMRQVRLGYGPLREAQERNRVYLNMLPNDRLLHSFRLTAGKESKAQPLGGWEAPDGELRGHFTGGHYLSGCALMFASTGDETLRQKANELVAELDKCQRDDGYLGAYPAAFYDRLKAYKPVWAPFYTYHKIMAGLVDMYVHCGNIRALEMAGRMADWAADWVKPLSDDEWARVQLVEHGGMNEVCFNLYALTGEKKFRDLGFRFEHKRFFNPLAAGEDKLAGHHSNTNIPKAIGAARGYEVSGDPRYRTIAENFWRQVAEHHAYCTGGTGATVPLSPDDGEGWHTADDLSNQLVTDAEECCCSYNMMKLSRHLFGWTADAKPMDYYERLLWNVRLGTQDEHGLLMYYVNMEPGYWKTFGTAYDSFWCCTGTGVEEYAKLADTLYFHDDSGVWVNQFAASEVEWLEKGVRLTQRTDFPTEERTELTVHAARPVRFALRVRKPYWCDGMEWKINGRPEKAAAGATGYAELEREWQPGDRVEVLLPMKLHAAPLPGNPALEAMMYGPLVLAGEMGRDGLTNEMMYGHAGPSRAGNSPVEAMPRVEGGAWAEKAGEPLRFRTRGKGQALEMKPLYQLMDERYTVYFLAERKA
ncbi:MAG: beta-L-arabinofuranosidase domain-containing protein, partial [Terracidiphilus sp.]